jgi:hypothetical protein
LGVLGLMAIERLATFLVGLFPSSPALWAVSLQLHSLFRRTSALLADATMHSISLQFAVLAGLAAMVVLAMNSRSWATLSFMVNHAALILVAVAVLVGTGSDIASTNGSPLEQGSWVTINWLRLGLFQYTLLVAGVAACACCHVMFLAQLAERDRARALALKELALEHRGKRRLRAN